VFSEQLVRAFSIDHYLHLSYLSLVQCLNIWVVNSRQMSQVAKALVMTENPAIKSGEINGTSLFISYLLALWGKSSLSERE